MQKSIDEVSIFADGLDHPECVAIHPDGSVWAGGEAGQIYRISPDGQRIEEVTNTGGFVLGIAFSPKAEWLAICDLKQKCVWKYELLTGTLTRFFDGVEGFRFMTPNYPVFDSEENLYISDSGSFRQVNGRIFKFNKERHGSIWNPGPFSFSNGMALSPDGNKLYVVCTWLPGVEEIEVLPDGSAGDRKVLCYMPKTCPDGIAIDNEGNFFISCYAPNAIYRYSKDGQLEEFIHDWESHTICNPTNIAFGGKNKQTLYIANLGRWHISKIEMTAPRISSHKSHHS